MLWNVLFIVTFVSVCKTVNQFFFFMRFPHFIPYWEEGMEDPTGLPFNSHCAIFLLSSPGQMLIDSSSSTKFNVTLCFLWPLICQLHTLIGLLQPRDWWFPSCTRPKLRLSPSASLTLSLLEAEKWRYMGALAMGSADRSLYIRKSLCVHAKCWLLLSYHSFFSFLIPEWTLSNTSYQEKA